MTNLQIQILKLRMSSKKCINLRIISALLRDRQDIIELLKDLLLKHKNVFKNISHVALFYFNTLKIKKCKICNKLLVWNADLKDINYCSKKCRFLDSKNIQKKAWNTCLLHYGVNNPYQAKEIKLKIKNTNLKKYGVLHSSSNKNIANKIKISVNLTYKNNKKQIKLKSIKTSLLKYGTEYPQQSEIIKDKVKEVFKLKYGNEYIFKTDYFKEKSKLTCLEKYNVEYSFQSDNNKEKSKLTNLEKYNTLYAAQSKLIRNKIETTNLSKYGFKNYNRYILWNNILKLKDYIIPLFNKEELLNNNKELTWKCVKCGNIFKQKIYCTNHNKEFRYLPRCLNCYPKMYGYSQTLKLIREFCQQYFTVIFNSFKILKRKQIDIFIPKINLAILVNGIYWHSREAGTPLNYHLNKTLLCLQLGIRLIHIWQDLWKNNQSYIKQRLINIFLNKEIINYNLLLPRDWYQAKEILNYKLTILLPEIIVRNGYHCENTGYLKYNKVINNIKF